MNIETIKHGMIVCDKFGNEYEVLAVVRNDRIFEDGVKLKCTKFVKYCINTKNKPFDAVGSIAWVNNTKVKPKVVSNVVKLKHGGGKGYARSYRNVYHTSNDVGDNVIQISDLRPTSTPYQIKRKLENLMYSVKKTLKAVFRCVKN